jgi:hypothetical protein
MHTDRRSSQKSIIFPSQQILNAIVDEAIPPTQWGEKKAGPGNDAGMAQVHQIFNFIPASSGPHPNRSDTLT